MGQVGGLASAIQWQDIGVRGRIRIEALQAGSRAGALENERTLMREVVVLGGDPNSPLRKEAKKVERSSGATTLPRRERGCGGY